MKNGQSMFLINRYTYSPGDKHYRRKSQSLQVYTMLLSGVVWLSIFKIFMELIISSNVMLVSNVWCVYLVQLA